MDKKQIWTWVQRIAFLLLLIYSFDNGFGLWFILATTAWYCIWYHKQLYRTMKQWSTIMLAVYDSYMIQKAVKQELKTLSEFRLEEEKKEEVIDINQTSPSEQSHIDTSQ